MKFHFFYKIALAFLIISSILGCSDVQKKYIPIIEGKIINAPKLVILQRLDSIPINIDTLELSSDGAFVCQTKNLQSDFYRLQLEEKSIDLILQSDSTTAIYLDYLNIDATLRFSKYNLSNSLQQLNLIRSRFEQELKTNHDSIKNMVGVVVTDSIVRLKYDKIDSLKSNYRSELDALLKQNQEKLIAIPILLQQSGNISIYTLPRDKELFMRTQFILSQNYSSSYQVKKFSNLVLQVFTKTDGIAQIKIGSKLPDLELFTPWNERLPLSSLVGKYVLVVVWKSDNETCRTRNKSISKMIWRYRSNGLETYMISLDTNGSQWQKIISEDELNCFHVTDLLGESSPAIANLGVTKLPALFLLNKEGRVVEKDIWGAKLEDALATLIKK